MRPKIGALTSELTEHGLLTTGNAELRRFRWEEWKAGRPVIVSSKTKLFQHYPNLTMLTCSACDQHAFGLLTIPMEVLNIICGLLCDVDVLRFALVSRHLQPMAVFALKCRAQKLYGEFGTPLTLSCVSYFKRQATRGIQCTAQAELHLPVHKGLNLSWEECLNIARAMYTCVDHIRFLLPEFKRQQEQAQAAETRFIASRLVDRSLVINRLFDHYKWGRKAKLHVDQARYFWNDCGAFLLTLGPTRRRMLWDRIESFMQLKCDSLGLIQQIVSNSHLRDCFQRAERTNDDICICEGAYSCATIVLENRPKLFMGVPMSEAQWKKLQPQVLSPVFYSNIQEHHCIVCFWIGGNSTIQIVKLKSFFVLDLGALTAKLNQLFNDVACECLFVDPITMEPYRELYPVMHCRLTKRTKKVRSIKKF